MLRVIALISCVLISTPVEAKRYKTMEAYYASRARHLANGDWHHRRHRVYDRVVLHRDQRREEGVTRLVERQSPIAYSYATGTSILNAYSGRYPVMYEHLCIGE